MSLIKFPLLYRALFPFPYTYLIPIFIGAKDTKKRVDPHTSSYFPKAAFTIGMIF